MEIKIELEGRAMGSLQLQCQLMEGGYLRKDVLVEFVELSVEVSPAETCPEVTCHHTIGIEHGDDVEGEIGAQHH